MTLEPEHRVELYGCGRVLAATPNSDLNRNLCAYWNDQLEEPDLYRWSHRHLTGESIGVPVWTDIDLQPWMAPDGDARPPLRSLKVRIPLSVDPNTILLHEAGGEIGVGPPPDTVDRAWVLALDPRRAEKRRHLPIAPHRVLIEPTTTFRDLYARMLACVAEEFPGLDTDEILSAMVSNEEDYANLLGHGIAMPHARVDGVPRSLLVVARPTVPATCAQPGREIQLAFMLLSPTDQPDVHLGYISEIARLIGTEAGRKELLEAPDAQALHNIIAKA